MIRCVGGGRIRSIAEARQLATCPASTVPFYNGFKKACPTAYACTSAVGEAEV